MVVATLNNPDQVLLPPASGIQRFNLYYGATAYTDTVFQARLPDDLLSAARNGVLCIDRVTMAHQGTIGRVWTYAYVTVNPLSTGGAVVCYLDDWTTATNPDWATANALNVGVNTQTMTSTAAFFTATANAYAAGDLLGLSVFGRIELPSPVAPQPVDLRRVSLWRQ
jgi:hypothetical protein